MATEDDEQDDWEPLAEDRLWARPGELQAEPEPEPQPEPPALVIEWQQAAPRAEEREQELQERARDLLAEPLPGNSVWGQLERRERRQRQVAERSSELRQAFGVCEVTGQSAPLLEYDEGKDGRDEREESEWFRALPEPEQQRLRDAWAHKRGLATANADSQKRNGNRRMVAAWVCYVATALVGSGLLLHVTLGAGVLCGFWWRRTAPDRFLDPLRAMGCLFGVSASVMVVQGVVNPMLFMDAVFVVALSALVGFDGEIRRTGGFDAARRDEAAG